MTKAQQRAGERAVGEHITILGKGTVKRNGQVFYIVSGAHGAQYTVGVFPERLQCNCKAGQNGQTCKHLAAVHLRIAQEREQASMTEQALAAMAPRGATPRQMEPMWESLAQRRESSMLARSAEPFSIWK